MFRWRLESTAFQFALVVLIITEILVLLMSSIVFDAFMNFCTLGHIPGTDIYLSPLQTFRTGIALASVLFVVIFAQELILMQRIILQRATRKQATS